MDDDETVNPEQEQKGRSAAGATLSWFRDLFLSVLIAIVVVVLFVCLLFAADRTVKVVKRTRRRREATRRLTAATVQAEAADRQRKAAAQASGELTSVMPTIHDVDPRLVDQPAPRHDGTSSRS